MTGAERLRPWEASGPPSIRVRYLFTTPNRYAFRFLISWPFSRTASSYLKAEGGMMGKRRNGKSQFVRF